MNSSFNKIKKKAIQIPQMHKWDLYTFLYNLKSNYQKGNNVYLLQIDENYFYETTKDEVIKFLSRPKYVPFASYGDPEKLEPQQLYDIYTEKRSEKIKNQFNNLGNNIIKYEDIKCLCIDDAILLEDNETIDVEGMYHGCFNYILHVDDEVINSISGWLGKQYDHPRKKTIEEFYNNIEEEYNNSKRSDHLIYIDAIEGYSFNKIKNGIYALFYTDKIKGFESIGEGFDISLIDNIDSSLHETGLTLNNNNGYVFINGKKVGEIKPNTKPGKMFIFLYNNKAIFKTHQEIVDHVNGKNYKTEKMVNSLTSDWKKEIDEKIRKNIKSKTGGYIIP